MFGGLVEESARLMAKELFIGKLDPQKIKASIYQTKFWPKYGRDEVYTHGSSQGTSTGHSRSTGAESSAAASC